MHQKTEWVIIYFEKNIVSEKWSLEKSLSSLIRRVTQLPSSAIFFSISAVKCFQHRLANIRKFQHELNVKYIVYILLSFINGIRCTILQRVNGKCRKLSCKNFYAFSKTCYFHSTVLAVGQSDYPRTPQDYPGRSRTALFVYSLYYMSV